MAEAWVSTSGRIWSWSEVKANLAKHERVPSVQAKRSDTSERVSSRRCAGSGQLNECLGATPVRLCVKVRWFGVVSGCSSDVSTRRANAESTVKVGLRPTRDQGARRRPHGLFLVRRYRTKN
jgi:hypothetical protein